VASPSDPNRDLLESHERMMRQIDANEARAQARHERMMRRFERSESLFIEAMSDLGASLKKNSEGIDETRVAIRDVGESFRAHTQAVLSMLDRLGPAPG
jgi:hypothetical protein